MKLNKYFSKELAAFLFIVILVILAFSYVLFGITGVRVVFGLIVMWLPFYLILSNFELTMAEKFVFSLLLGITLFPSIVFLLGLLISFRVAIVVTFVLLIGVFLRFYKVLLDFLVLVN